MTFHVECQVVRTTEGSFALGALEGSVAGVFAEVTRELVATRESPAAAGPGALVGFFTGVSPHVSLQVRRLRVSLAAVLVVAYMNGGLPSRPILPRPFWLLHRRRCR